MCSCPNNSNEFKNPLLIISNTQNMHQTVEQIKGNGLMQIHKIGNTPDTEKCLWSECLNNFIYT